MNLYLRKVIHPQAHDNYRVILKCEEGEFEIGSIGIQDGAAWAWEPTLSSRCAITRRKGKATIAGTA